jgi:hypothetical protein
VERLNDLEHAFEASVSRVARVILQKSTREFLALRVARAADDLPSQQDRYLHRAGANAGPFRQALRTRPDISTCHLGRGTMPRGKPQNRIERQSSTAFCMRDLWLASCAVPETCAPTPLTNEGRAARVPIKTDLPPSVPAARTGCWRTKVCQAPSSRGGRIYFTSYCAGCPGGRAPQF